MAKRRSIGVSILGWTLLALGFMNFLICLYLSLGLSLFYPQSPLLHFYGKSIFGAEHFQIEILKDCMWQISMQHPILTITDFIIIPVIFFIIAMGGIGLLGLKEHWRKTLMWVVPTGAILYISRLVYSFHTIIMYFIDKYLKKAMISQRFIDAIEANLSDAKNIFLQIIAILISFSIIFIIYFFTRPQVKAQFK